jgi:hypothetical protein
VKLFLLVGHKASVMPCRAAQGGQLIEETHRRYRDPETGQMVTETRRKHALGDWRARNRIEFNGKEGAAAEVASDVAQQLEERGKRQRPR